MRLFFPFLAFFLFPGASSQHLFYSILSHVLFNSDQYLGIARFGGIAGLFLLVWHHRTTDETEKRPYGRLDRYVALMLIFGASYVLVSVWYTIGASPYPYVGFTLFLWIGRLLVFCVSLFLWAGALRSSRGALARWCSALCMVLYFLPPPPTNNPELLKVFETCANKEACVAASYNDISTDMPNIQGETSDEEVNNVTPETVVSHKFYHPGRLPILLLMIYTWMRLGKRALPQTPRIISGYGVSEMILAAQVEHPEPASFASYVLAHGIRLSLDELAA